MASKLEKYYKTLPKVFNAENNPVINALLSAFAASDEEITTQIENTKAQLFIRTAEGQYLDRLASSLGVSRPVSIGLSDTQFQELIPNLSLKAKQIRKTFYDTADVFWGPLFSRANITSANAATFNVSVGDEFKIKVDNGEVQTIKAITGDIATNGAATALEIQALLSKADGITVSIIEDSLTSSETINIRTNTPGPSGVIEILTSSMVGSTKLDFTVGKTELIQQDQRVMIYEIRPNELTIEIPAIVPALRRTLRGSHHFHADSTLEGPVAPENGIWQGSFFYDTTEPYSVSSQRTIIEEVLAKGNIYTKVTVDTTANFTDETGTLIFGWGKDSQEVGVRFRGVPNTKTILLDPSYTFQKDHAIGETVNVLVDQTPFIPAEDGSDLAIYLTSPSNAREIVQEILKTLAAAGIVVNFVILAPTYKYLQDNPYLTSDDAPECD